MAGDETYAGCGKRTDGGAFLWIETEFWKYRDGRFPMGLKIGDYIVWRGEAIWLDDGVSRRAFMVPGTVGRILNVRTNPLAEQLRAEGILVSSGYIRVELESGTQLVLNAGNYPGFEKLAVQ